MIMLSGFRRNWGMPALLCCLSLGLASWYLYTGNAHGQIPPPSYGSGSGTGGPTVAFTSSEYYVAEDGGTATITVTLSAASSQPVTVDYVTSDDTATAPVDYVPAVGTLTFSPGQTSASFQVIINNAGFSQDLSLFLSLNNPTGATLGDPSAAVLTIIPPNFSPTVQFEFDQYYIAEQDGSATITVILSGPTSHSVSVAYSTSDGTATAPTDYISASGTLTFSPDQTSASFPVTINNAGFTQNLTVNLTLSNPAGATLGTPSTAVLTILPPDTTCPN